MGNFRSGDRDRGFDSRRPRGRGGFRDRFSGGFERRRPEMHKAVCSKCKQECEVPFRPTGDKPVFCSDCFKKEGGSSFSPSSRNNSSSSGISQEQYKEINAKLDKILGILKMIEFEDEEGEPEGKEEEE